MSIQADWTTPPPVIPRKFAADSVIEWDDNLDAHAALGLQWESAECGTTYTTTGVCVDPSVDPLTPTKCASFADADPFTVYGLYTDSIGAHRPLADHEAAARARFLATESGGLDAAVLAWLVANGNNVGEATRAAGSWEESYRLTLGELEHLWISHSITPVDPAHATSQTERTIFMSPEAVPFLADGLSSTGGILRTTLGSKVAVIAMDPDSMYVTGAWKGHRGPVLADVATPDLAINDTSIIVQRNYAAGTACGATGMTIKTPA